jgi:putative membrane protein
MRKELCTLVAGLAIAAPAFAGGNDAAFLKKAADGGMLEVKLGEHAARNAASADVRAFGQRMVDDHSKANRELADLAKKEGVDVPTTLSTDHQKMAEKLLSMAGSEFDKSYMHMMVEDHEKDVAAFKAEAKEGKTEVDRWAAQTVPTLEEHLKQARDIDKRVNQKSASAK